MYFMRLKDVMKATGLSRSSIYKQVSIGEFPRPVNISGRAVAWVSDEIDTWVVERIAERNRQNPA